MWPTLAFLLAVFFFPLKLKHLFIKQFFYDTFFLSQYLILRSSFHFFFTDFLRCLLSSYSRHSSAGHTESVNAVLEFCQENTLVIANTLFQQHKRRLYTWTSPDGQYRNQIDYILCSWRWRSSIQSAKTRPGADCGSDHELLIAKFRLEESRENH